MKTNIPSPTDSPASANTRRRFFWLLAAVAAPLVVLAIVGFRALRYEAVATRVAAAQQADEVAEWAIRRLMGLLHPFNDAFDPIHGSTDLEHSALLHPTRPDEDFVLRMRGSRADHWIDDPAGRGYEGCLLNRENELVYPASPDSGHDLPGGAEWDEVRKAHSLMREIHRQVLESLAKPRSGNLPGLFSAVKIDDVSWVAWRVELGDSGHRVLWAMPEERIARVVDLLLDPAHPNGALEKLGVRPRLAPYAQLVLFVGNSRNEIYKTPGGERVITSSTRSAGTISQATGLGDLMRASVLSERKALGTFSSQFGVSHVLDLAGTRETRFRILVNVWDKEAMLASVRWHTWGLAALVTAAILGALIALRAVWRVLRQQQQLSEAKSNFISGVSHELRAPLASVRLMAESLQRGTTRDPAKQAEYFRLIVQESKRVSGLIENVLDLSRIEQGRKDYAFESCDLSRLVAETIAGLQPYAADKDVRLALDTLHDARPIDCDSGAVQQVLVNLVDNAIKHSPAGAIVRITLAFEPHEVRLTIEDRGPGIPREEHEKIFEPFFRRGSELRRETQGVGLGLGIARHAVLAHGGTIRVEGEPGSGSRFIVVLPTEQPQLATCP